MIEYLKDIVSNLTDHSFGYEYTCEKIKCDDDMEYVAFYFTIETTDKFQIWEILYHRNNLNRLLKDKLKLYGIKSKCTAFIEEKIL